MTCVGWSCGPVPSVSTAREVGDRRPSRYTRQNWKRNKVPCRGGRPWRSVGPLGGIDRCEPGQDGRVRVRKPSGRLLHPPPPPVYSAEGRPPVGGPLQPVPTRPVSVRPGRHSAGHGVYTRESGSRSRAGVTARLRTQESVGELDWPGRVSSKRRTLGDRLRDRTLF